MSDPLGLLALAAIVALLLFAWWKPANRAYPWVMLAVAGLGLLLTVLPPGAVDIPWFSLRWTEMRYQRGAEMAGGLGIEWTRMGFWTIAAMIGWVVIALKPAQTERHKETRPAPFLLALIPACLSSNMLMQWAGWVLIGIAIETQSATETRPVQRVLNRIGDVLVGLAVLLLIWEAARVSDFRQLDLSSANYTLNHMTAGADFNISLVTKCAHMISFAALTRGLSILLACTTFRTAWISWAVLTRSLVSWRDLVPFMYHAPVEMEPALIVVPFMLLVLSVSNSAVGFLNWLGLACLTFFLVFDLPFGFIAFLPISLVAIYLILIEQSLMNIRIGHLPLAKLGGLWRRAALHRFGLIASIAITGVSSLLTSIADGRSGWITSLLISLTVGFSVFRLNGLIVTGPARRRISDDEKNADISKRTTLLLRGGMMCSLVLLGYFIWTELIFLSPANILDAARHLLPALLAGGFAYVLYGPAWRITQKMLFTSPIDLYLKLDVFGPNLANMQFGNPKIDPWLPRVGAFAKSRTYRWSRAVYVRVHRMLVVLSEPEKWRWEALGRPVEGLAIAVRLMDAGVGGLGLVLRALANAAAATASLADKHLLGRLSGRP